MCTINSEVFDLVLAYMFTLRSDYLWCEVAPPQIVCDVCLYEIVKKRKGLGCDSYDFYLFRIS